MNFGQGNVYGFGGSGSGGGSSGGSEYSDTVLAYQALGSNVKAETVGLPAPIATFNWGMADGQLRMIPVLLKKSDTITGARLYMRTQGDYVADNNNKVGLYSYASGLYTKVAECANDGDLWKATSNSWIVKDFLVPYEAEPGLYFISVLYNSSSQSTGPAIAAGVSVNNGAQMEIGFADNAKLFGAAAAQTDLPATITGAGLTSQVNILYGAVY